MKNSLKRSKYWFSLRLCAAAMLVAPSCILGLTVCRAALWQPQKEAAGLVSASTEMQAAPESILPVTDGRFVMFDDAERSGWFSHQNSFITAAAPVHSGTRSLSFAEANKSYQFTMGWEGACWSAPFDRVTFWIHGGVKGGQTLAITGMKRDVLKNTYEDGLTVTLPNPAYGAALPAGRWEKVSIPLADLGAANRTDFRGIKIETKGSAGFFMDDMALEGTVPASAEVAVNASQVIRYVNARIYGMNTYGVPQAGNPVEVGVAKEAGYRLHRAFYPTFGVFSGMARSLPFAETVGAEAMGCVLYTDVEDFDGKKFGTAQQAAAMVAYANVPTDAPARLLSFHIGVDYKGHDWGTVGRWVNIRATEDKLAQDDRFNVMRIKHPAPFHVKLWELDNEPWMRGNDTDWKAYAVWCKEADRLMRQVDSTIQTGVSLIGGDEGPGLVKHEIVNPATGKKHTGFNEVVLYYLSGQGQAGSPGRYRPDFVICHNYAGVNDGPSANLATLFTYQQRNGSDWVSTAQMYRDYLRQYYGAAGDQTYFLVTENNIASTFPLTKQTVSLVGGLYAADDLASIMQSRRGDFEGLTWHDWDDGPLEKGGYQENPYLYGWRNEAGYGVYRDGARTKYPIHYAFRMLSHYFGQQDDEVVKADSSTPYLAAYAVRQKSGNLAVLLINKARDTAIRAGIHLRGYTALPAATLYRYGKQEDRSESDITVTPLPDGRESLVCPGYSMSVVTFTWAGGKAAAPTEVRAIPGSGKVHLVWTAMSGAAGYDIYRAANGGKPALLKSNVPAAMYTDSGLANNVSYCYTVVTHGGDETRSEQVCATLRAAPGIVTGMAAVAADNQARVSWQPVPGASGYTVRRARSAHGPWTIITTHPYERQYDQTIAFTAHRDRGLQNGVTYYYQVCARNAGGEGAAAGIAATPQALPAEWKAVDISGRPYGSTRFDAGTNRFTLEGEGAAWYGGGDGRFVYRRLQGDGAITARVLSGENGLYEKNTFGVMLRDSLQPGKETRWALMALTPVYPANGSTNGPVFMISGPGSGSKMLFQSDSVSDNAKRIRAPYWVRLTRRGDVITGFISPDGSDGSWQQFSSDTLQGLPNEVYMGLIANSMVFFAPRAGMFDHVTVSR